MNFDVAFSYITCDNFLNIIIEASNKNCVLPFINIQK